MGSDSLFKRIRESVIFLLIVAGVVYGALYYTKDSNKVIPDKPTTEVYVQDNGNLLTTSEKERLEKTCENLYKSKGIKLVFLTVDDIPSSYNLEEYGSAVYNKWGLDKETSGNSLLLIYDTKNKKIRLETTPGINKNITYNAPIFVLSETKATILQGKPYQAFDTMVAEITKPENLVVDKDGKVTVLLTSATDDFPFVAESNQRVETISLIFLLASIIVFFIRTFRKGKIAAPSLSNKNKRTTPVAYRTSYDEPYGDKDHIFTEK